MSVARKRLRSSWWLFKLGVIVLFNPDYVDRMVIMTGALRAQTPSGRRAMQKVIDGG
jgi:hypothetical protein